MGDSLLVYGANGYTGQLVVEEALAHGLRPVLAGRSADKIQPLARALNLESRVFALDDPAVVAQGLHGMHAVAHCAGPFAHTAHQMAEGCMRAGCHYLDITGEVAVFEALLAMDAPARAAGVMLMPGTGFDVVPSDCLAAHLHRRLPEATHLTLAFYSKGKPSHGTATTIVENVADGGLVRREGQLTRVPAAWRVRRFDFGGEEHTAMTIPWGDVSTAHFTTGIPNIEVFMAAPAGLRNFSKLSRFFGPVLGSGPVQRFLKAKIDAGPAGPTPEARQRGYCLLYGEAHDAQGKKVAAHQRTPEGYTHTAQACVHIARKVLAGEAKPGYQTPAAAYGADLVLELPGCTRKDL